jgi:tight adherence protein B
MMSNTALVALGSMLLLGLLLGSFVIARTGSDQAVRNRVRGLAHGGMVTVVLPTIRVGAASDSPGKRRALGFFGYNPEMSQAQVVPWQVVLLGAAAVAVAAAVFVTRLTDSIAIGAVVSLAIGWQTARSAFKWQQSRYSDALFLQIPDTLGLMVRVIRAGLPMAEALRSISREMPSPTKEEFAKVAGDIAVGRAVDIALVRLHDRTNVTEYAFLAVTLGLQSQTGGSLAETLENLSDTVRKRVAMAKRAQAMAGEAKAQAGLLLVLPFIAAGAMSFLQPFYISTFTENPTGQRMAMIALGLMVLGVVTIRYLIRQAGRD